MGKEGLKEKEHDLILMEGFSPAAATAHSNLAHAEAGSAAPSQR